MVERNWPYNLPIWRWSFRASSPDGRYIAEINPAWEVSMGNPTYGTLCMSVGLHLERCNPSFLWSNDSRYLAVPQFYLRFGLFRRQHLLLVDVKERRVFASAKKAYYFQPESFTGGQLVVTKNPFGRSKKFSWQIPEDISTQFTRYHFDMWSCEPA
jgi:hypothetical protein